jgi:uncharacterized protein YggU (UPF0235/DUF167 family)
MCGAKIGTKPNKMKIFVKAKPGAKVMSILRIDEGLFGATKDEAHFMVAVKEPPIDGRANRAIEKAISEYFHVPQSRVRVVRGHSSRNKILEMQ